MKYFFLILLSAFMPFGLCAGSSLQDTIFNQTGPNGLKQGYWKKYYPNGNLMYVGFFKDGKPAGEMKRYFESGNLQADMQFNKQGNYAGAKIYYEDGTLASDGFYANSKKDSIWDYYSYYDQKLKSRETYKNGLKDGYSWNYYPDGTVFEQTMWKHGLKDGIWKQFYQDGSLRLNANWAGGKLTGDYLVYYNNGNPMVVGLYKDDKREGTWEYYNENGSRNQEIVYADGKPMNKQELTRQQQEFFDKIEKNIGKIREPDINDFVPHSGYSGNEY